MDKIESIKIEGLQSHEESELELSEGTNVLIGDSDAGKSAVIRSLWWLRFNRPSGDQLNREGVSKRSVEVKGGNDSILRQKTKTKNRYVLSENGGKLQYFNSVGTEVPEIVIKTLPIQEINFRRQRDPIFFLTQTPGERSRFLNSQVSDLWMIDRFTSDLNRELREADKKEKEEQDKAEDEEKKAETLQWVDKFSERISKAKERRDKLSKEKDDCSKVEESVTTAENVSRKMPDRRFIRRKLRKIEELLRKIEELKNRRNVIEDIEDSLEKIDRIDRTLKSLPNYSDKKKNRLSEIHNRLIELEREKAKIDELESVLDNADEVIKLQKDAHREAVKCRRKFEEEFPEICPLCGANWSKR